jgi:hypothetical protein
MVTDEQTTTDKGCTTTDRNLNLHSMFIGPGHPSSAQLKRRVTKRPL